jgi:DNA-directed RNA polymerase specialized sigma24 family protein
VVLRGRLSNFDVQDFVRDTEPAVSELRSGPSVAATHGSRSSFESVRLRLGDEAVAELVAAFVAGTTREELADHYGVSLSSVKRLLRGVRVRRRHSRSAGGPEQ